ncbi:hypothetical protein C8P68_11210 [Mucilaginibacter yixingensis]|uniref:Uncharacterized protein n=1 Tax=Mucilaginibacter yixingensis TaxID=1295612 RepID=A0A2T5J4G5_9SPHI|nr:hypothetical protein [Mucilaginibacter yixingensis]PTQ92410.1 hypothetical protein C8P68_11210 [Mucilaginibacter yixingensis]
MFSDYKKQVLLTYKKKRELNQLSLNLLHSTAGKLRKECLIVLRDRYRQQDLRILKDFFETEVDGADYMQIIRRHDRDKFKPLDNYLKGDTDDTEDKNVELLAWLIDYPDRPYQFRPNQETKPVVEIADFTNLADEPVKSESSAAIIDISDPTTEKAPKTDEPDIPAAPMGTVIQLPGKNKRVTQVRNRLVVLLGAVFLGGITYYYWPTKVVDPYANGCMFWKDDHFERSACHVQRPVPLVPYDSVRLARFHAIKDYSTITKASVGKVWYFKNKGHLEFYTTAGFHPIDTVRWLKPLTEYMYDKYILHKNNQLLSTPLQSSVNTKP